MSERPLISLCMIVKNEEKNLPRCLDSVKGVVDEIIIVDTGSTDKTKEIALYYGAIVYDFEWIDDFSAARNYGIEKAKGEWIFILDADEELEENSKKRVRKILRDSKFDGYEIVIRSLERKDSLALFHDEKILRLFRNKPAYRFENCYHEQIFPSIIAHQGKITISDLIIFHYGYTTDTVQGGEIRQNRAIRILKKQLQQNPNSVYYKLALSFEYYNMGDYDSAYQLILDTLINNSTPALANIPQSMIQQGLIILGDVSIKKKEYQNAKEFADAGLIINANSTFNRYCYSTKALAQLLEVNEFISAKKTKSNVLLTEINLYKDYLLQSKNIFYNLLQNRDQTIEARNRLSEWIKNCDDLYNQLEKISFLQELDESITQMEQ